MLKDEAIELFKSKIKNRRPVKVAKQGEDWYIYSENMLNGGEKLDGIIDQCFYKVSDNKLYFIPMMKMPEGLNFVKV